MSVLYVSILLNVEMLCGVYNHMSINPLSLMQTVANRVYTVRMINIVSTSLEFH